jgi:branched-subunit amino acid aminotransferase/4-amino-4-deoxychorismate lyase
MQSKNYAYVSGHFLPESEATVSIFDRGFLYGHGVFETMRIYDGKIFRIYEHLDRFLTSAKHLEIECPLASEELRAILAVLSERNKVQGGFARLYLTSGASNVDAMAHSEYGVSLVAICCSRQFACPRLEVIIASNRLDPSLSCHKTANRLPYMLARREAEKAGADEAVLLNMSGRPVELSTSNLFVVKAGELFTPALSEGPLPGVTRSVVLLLASERMLPAHEVMMGLPMLETADEIFATNTLMEIVPVLRFKKRALSEGQITKRLRDAYREFVRQELEI